jgi:hypothetical protein
VLACTLTRAVCLEQTEPLASLRGFSGAAAVRALLTSGAVGPGVAFVGSFAFAGALALDDSFAVCVLLTLAGDGVRALLRDPLLEATPGRNEGAAEGREIAPTRGGAGVEVGASSRAELDGRPLER